MKKVLLLAVMSLFVGAGAANACDGHAKAKASVDKKSTATTASVTGAKKDCSDADKAACASAKATKVAGKANPSCCATKKGAKMTEQSTQTTTTPAKM